TFTRRDRGFVVSDLGSLNGTYVNRDRIDGDVLLSGGDEVQIGKYRLIYFPGAPAQGGSQ
uniref:FHA domain-containing protein n=1 Tax=uncultured Aeromicrobium sp. TaxID=337820 RepID=UPI0025FFBC6A